MLTIVGMAVAVGAVVALVGISQGFEQSFLSIYRRREVDIVVQQAGSKQRLTSALDQSLGEKIGKVPGVRSVTCGLVDMMSLDELGPTGVLVQAWPPGSIMFDELKILSGRKLQAQDTKSVMLGKVLAASLQKKVGDELTVFENERFKVVGIFESYSVYENGGILMLLEELQRFMGREHQVSGFTVAVEKPADDAVVERVREAIERLDKSLVATPTKQFVESTTEIQFVRAMAWITSAVALVIGAVGMLNTMVMSVFERTREIGILRAIGWRRLRVVRMILLESVILSLTGAVFGTLGAMLLTRVLSSRPAAAGMIGGHLAPGVVVQGFVIAILVGLLGAAYPAYWGARLLPTEAIRHE
ncbi:MAG: ABC transporter permease [Pirellulales bacterium]